MTKTSIGILAFLSFATTAQAHQLWIEQPAGQNAVIRFGEFAQNLREASPGLLDKFGKPVGSLLSAKGEQKAAAVKTGGGFELPFAASSGESIVAEDASYPLYKGKQGDKETTNRYLPAARLITSFAAQPGRLTLDLVPTGNDGEFRLLLQGQPKAKAKVEFVTRSGWSKAAETDDNGLVRFDMPWKGTYVAEVSVNERTAGERPGANGVEKFEGVSYVTSVTYVKTDGLEALPAAPVAAPHK